MKALTLAVPRSPAMTVTSCPAARPLKGDADMQLLSPAQEGHSRLPLEQAAERPVACADPRTPFVYGEPQAGLGDHRFGRAAAACDRWASADGSARAVLPSAHREARRPDGEAVLRPYPDYPGAAPGRKISSRRKGWTKRMPHSSFRSPVSFAST